MLPHLHKVHLTDFRAHMARDLAFVRERLGHLWLMSHNRHVATIVPPRDGLLVEEFRKRSVDEVRRRQDALWEKWKRVQELDGSYDQW
ncbi:hypothetical protein [Tranquillimonas alkanivorans]|uniref:Uncharacterized protein n=1 Tax=Tranquillimonas alkanivorans TaxID=441119 RepID=A0A1I5SZY6_9RHOB|nr:hypothetical protein [Tranquillimonas alkanivorans]SFP75776.1 hypothetical protein SAMN04488047_11255 [Tranquillimonas alkanivorans]